MNRPTDSSDDGPSTPEWENYIIPIFGLAIVVLVLLVLCQFYSRTLRKFCCPRSVQNRIRNQNRRNNDDEEEVPDIPPSYSVLSHTNPSFEVFQVDASDGRSTGVQQIETVTDKLPSYKEILDAQKEEKEKAKNQNSNNENVYEAIEQNEISSMDTINLENEEETIPPPPYRPQTARRRGFE